MAENLQNAPVPASKLRTFFRRLLSFVVLWTVLLTALFSGNRIISDYVFLAVILFLAVVGLALVPVGIGLYSWYIYRLTGNPFEWAASIERWGYYPGGTPWLELATTNGRGELLSTSRAAFMAGTSSPATILCGSAMTVTRFT